MAPVAIYKKFITELLRKHMAILGPNISRDVALQVPGITIDASGDVTEITGDPLLVLTDLVSGFMALSAPVTQLILYNLLETTPVIKAEYNQPLGRIKLVCSITTGEEATAEQGES